MHFNLLGNLRFSLRSMAAAIAMLFIATYASGTRAATSFAFYYGTDIPWEALGAFDVAVVEPGNVGPSGWQHRLNPGTTVAAYVAVGEVHPTRPYFSRMRPEWKLGDNPAWGSIVVDQTAPGWTAFYLAQVIKPLWDRGFRAFFLDTLDSFYLVAKTPEAQQKQIAGMAALVREIKRTYPDAKLIFNRGFEILPQVHTAAYAVAAESLFQGWDAGRKQYRDVPQADRDWILAQLRKCQTDYKLPVIAIDYVPPRNRALARETARKIRALGIIPWVTNPALDMMGVGQVEVLPRQVLAIHDEPGHLADVSLHELHRVGAMPLNYLGLDVRYVYYGSPELAALAQQPLAGRYAGVLTWFNRGTFHETAPLLKLMATAREEGVPLVMVDDLPGAATLGSLGIDVGPGVRQTKPLTLEKRSPHVGFEIEPRPPTDGFAPSTVRAGQGDVWLRVHSEASGDADVIAITPWGGFAADRYVKVDLPADQGGRWVVNPIEFFRAAFKIDPAIPVPDVTTETGRRLLLIHVDGDGFPSRAELPGTPLASEVMLKEFLQRYRWPSTVSVIEGELAPRGLYAALSPLMEKTAREIFALPHVEIGSHTYSHPFYWADAELGLQVAGRVVGLKIPGYSYDAVREITGARDYVDQLGTGGKKTRVLLWSGNTEPLATPVRLAYEAGLLNMNGGFTTISKADPSLTLVAPLGMMKGDYYQVYAPMQNENVYTNSWTGPFYGYERVIETFELTDRPLRLKPVNIYYHTYIASKRASIASLHKVYDWAAEQLKQQQLHPVFASEYIERVLDWRRATVARTDTGVELRGGPHLRQWRVAANAPLAAMDDASGIAGAVVAESARYLNVSKSIAHYVYGTLATAGFYLESANAKLMAWRTDGRLQRMEFEGHLPLHARFYAPRCELQAATGLRGSRRGNLFEVEGSLVGKTTVVLRCTE
jgi:polysaccharide biosynthesis protein PelA